MTMDEILAALLARRYLEITPAELYDARFAILDLGDAATTAEQTAAANLLAQRWGDALLAHDQAGRPRFFEYDFHDTFDPELSDPELEDEAPPDRDSTLPPVPPRQTPWALIGLAAATGLGLLLYAASGR